MKATKKAGLIFLILCLLPGLYVFFYDLLTDLPMLLPRQLRWQVYEYYPLFVLGVMALLWLAVRLLVKSLRQRTLARSAEHSHDRIDHSRDLTIDAATGKASRAALRQEHSPKAHWQEQLNTLLATGIVSPEEYRELMKNHQF